MAQTSGGCGCGGSPRRKQVGKGKPVGNDWNAIVENILRDGARQARAHLKIQDEPGDGDVEVCVSMSVFLRFSSRPGSVGQLGRALQHRTARGPGPHGRGQLVGHPGHAGHVRARDDAQDGHARRIRRRHRRASADGHLAGRVHRPLTNGQLPNGGDRRRGGQTPPRPTARRPRWPRVPPAPSLHGQLHRPRHGLVHWRKIRDALAAGSAERARAAAEVTAIEADMLIPQTSAAAGVSYAPTS
jgi:hypothetical protein